MSVRKPARRMARDARRVHDDVEGPAELGLVRRTGSGAVICPFDALHIDMRLAASQALAD